MIDNIGHPYIGRALRESALQFNKFSGSLSSLFHSPDIDPNTLGIDYNLTPSPVSFFITLN